MAKKKKKRKVRRRSSGSGKIVRVIIAAVIIVVILLIVFKLVPALREKISDRRADKQAEKTGETAQDTDGGENNPTDQCYTPRAENIVFDEETGQGYVNNMVIVYVEDGTDPEDAEVLAEEIDGEIIGSIPQLNEYQVEVTAAEEEELEALCEQLEDNEIVSDARIDNVMEASAEYTPDDKWGGFLFFKEKWDENKPDGKNWHLEATKVPSAWNLLEQESERVQSVPVGVIDTGIYRNHEDIQISLTQDTRIVEHNHGTETTGIIGAIADNKKGITGIAKDSEIFFTGTVKSESDFTNDRGSFQSSDSQIEFAICGQLDNNCHAINISLSSYQEDDRVAEETAQLYGDMLCRMIHKYGKDFIIVQSAGNQSGEAKYNGLFASIDKESAEEAIRRCGYGTEMTVDDVMGAKIIVGGVSDKKTDSGQYQLAHFSNYGDMVDICAPAVDIYTTSEVSWTGSKYASVPGTSFAAPIVTGIVELAWSANNDLTAAQVKDILTSTAANNVVSYTGYEKDFPVVENPSGTYGMVDANAAVQKALNTEAQEDKDPLDEYNDAVDKTVGDGEWNERTTMRIDMGMNGDADTASSLVECVYDLHVTGYTADNPAGARASGTAHGNVFGAEMDYDIEYAEGVTTYTMTAPFPLSYEAEGEMSVFDFTMISDRTIRDASVKGQTMTFDLTQGAMPDGSFGFIAELAQMENIEMDQATATVTVSDDGMLDMISVDILGSLVYGNESLDTAFTLTYEFED